MKSCGWVLGGVSGVEGENCTEIRQDAPCFVQEYKGMCPAVVWSDSSFILCLF